MRGWPPLIQVERVDTLPTSERDGNLHLGAGMFTFSSDESAVPTSHIQLKGVASSKEVIAPST